MVVDVSREGKVRAGDPILVSYAIESLKPWSWMRPQEKGVHKGQPAWAWRESTGED